MRSTAGKTLAGIVQMAGATTGYDDEKNEEPARSSTFMWRPSSGYPEPQVSDVGAIDPGARALYI